ncbi:MAG: L-threonylcarbamoyladenylate synthase [Dehalococcoidales bacterium]
MSSLRKATSETILRGISLLKSGHPVSFPTDTVYALGAPISDVACVAKVFEIKQRPLTLALPILLAESDDVVLVALDVSDIARRLMQEFWPGALTLVFKKKPFVPDIVTAGSPTVAVRIAAHPLAIEIVKGVGVPLVGTSANIHGRPSPTTAQDVESQIGDKVELIIDAGKTPGGIESTILDMSEDKPRILRQGAVARAQIEKFCRIY